MRGTGFGRAQSRKWDNPMRAVIYARYSSDLQSEASIDDQVRLCRERVEKENGTVVDVYADYAISGGSVRNRPGMQVLLDQAKTGKFDHVIAEALDRVSRDQEDIAAIYKSTQTSASSLLQRARSANCMWASKAQ